MRSYIQLSVLSATLMFALTACQKPTEPKAEQATQAADTQTVTDPVQTGQVELSQESAEYKQWVQEQIDGLLADSEKFVGYLKTGDLENAKAIYPLARMYFERSEPIAESFGDLDPRIDNREADLEQGEIWTGFHAIEKILWTQNTTKGTGELGDKLINDIKELRAKIPTADVTPELMIQGSVDLLNEVSTTKITGEEEIFSKTDLYDFKANIEGAEKIFEILKPKLTTKNPNLVKTLEERFKAVNDLLDKHKVGNKDYKPYTDLTNDDTKELAEAVNKLGEPLGQMGIVME